MVGREGVETATMIASLASQSDMRTLLVGGVLGTLCAAPMSLAWTRLGRRVNLSRLFQVTAIFMVLFSVQLLVYAFHEFTEAGALPGLDNAYWQLESERYGPDGQYGHWLSYGLILVPAMFLASSCLRDRATRSSAPLGGIVR
jgi:high-affinity iron transporter